MNNANDELPNPNRVFCADMTKLISADSLLTSLNHPLISVAPLSDPDAERDFEKLATIITNDSLLYFEAPRDLSFQLSPLMKAWVEVAKACESTGIVLTRPTTPPVGRPSNEEVCRAASIPFTEYLMRDGVIDKVVAWARFQLSDRELSEIFWKNNSEAELQSALGTYKDEMKEIPAKVVSAISSAKVNFQRISTDHLTNGNWTQEQFVFAYALWAFVKGYRYAASLGNDHLYVVHWLREPAVETTWPDEDATDEFTANMLQWGTLLVNYLKDLGPGIAEHDITETLLKLREFTIRELHHLSDHKKLSKLIEDGLFQSLPNLENILKREGRLSRLLSKELPELAEDAPWPASLVNYAIRRFSKVRHDQKRRQYVRLLITRSKMISGKSPRE